jgi:hypothetical protein
MVGLTAYSRLAASVALIDIAGPLGLLSAVEASFDLEQNVRRDSAEIFAKKT